MSNPVYLVRTKFENLNGEITYGFRMFDNYDNEYNNLYTEDIMNQNDLDFLKEIITDNMLKDAGKEMIDYLIENELGINIDDSFYDWVEIKEILKKC